MSSRRALWDGLFAGGGGPLLPGYLECAAAASSGVSYAHDARDNPTPFTICGWLQPASWPADTQYGVIAGEEDVGVSSSWSLRLGSQTRGDEMSVGAYKALAETPFGNSYRLEFGRYSCPPIGVRGSSLWCFVAATFSAANGWRVYVQNNRGLATVTGTPPAALLNPVSGLAFARALVAGVASSFGDCDYSDWRTYAAELVEADLDAIVNGTSALVPTQRFPFSSDFGETVAPARVGTGIGTARIARSALVPVPMQVMVWDAIGTSITAGQLGALFNGTLFKGGARVACANALRGRAVVRGVGGSSLSGGYMPDSDGVNAALVSTLYPRAALAGARNPTHITLECAINNARGSGVKMSQTRADWLTLAATLEAGLGGLNPYTLWWPDAPYLFSGGPTRYDQQYIAGAYEALRNVVGPAVAALYPTRKYSTMLDTEYVPSDIGADGTHYEDDTYLRLGTRVSEHFYVETPQPADPSATKRTDLRAALGSDLYFLVDTCVQPTEVGSGVSAYPEVHVDDAGTGGATVTQPVALARPEWTGAVGWFPFGVFSFVYEFFRCSGGAIPAGAIGMAAKFQLDHDVQVETYHGGCIASPESNGGASKPALYLRTLDGGLTYFWAFQDDAAAAAFALPVFDWVPDFDKHTIEAGFLGGSRTNAANYFVRIDGVDLVSTTTTAGGGGAAGNGALGAFWDGATTYFPWNGWIGDWVAFNPAMNGARYAALRAFLAESWWP